MYANELYHFGVKGMKWGVRRYQNKDGSLTSAGQRRYDRDNRESNGKKKRPADANRWVKEDLNRSRNLVNETSMMSNKLKGINDKAMRNQPRKSMDLSNMTDKQMRDEINRALLERQYNDMFNQQNVSKGREHVSRILELSGDALAVTASALGIALAIKELKG